MRNCVPYIQYYMWRALGANLANNYYVIFYKIWTFSSLYGITVVLLRSAFVTVYYSNVDANVIAQYCWGYDASNSVWITWIFLRGISQDLQESNFGRHRMLCAKLVIRRHGTVSCRTVLTWRYRMFLCLNIIKWLTRERIRDDGASHSLSMHYINWHLLYIYLFTTHQAVLSTALTTRLAILLLICVSVLF